MKKFLAILLTAALALSFAFACAEEAQRLNENNDTLDFYLNVPNGMSLDQNAYDPGVVGWIEVGGMPDLQIMFSLIPDDSYSDMDMNDLTDEDIEVLTATLKEDLGDSAIETYDMPCGLKAVVVRDTAKSEYITMTLKGGYFFYMTGYHNDFSALSDEEAQAVKGAFDSFTFEEKAQ